MRSATIEEMYVVMITPECAPVAKVGGLGDVVHGLSCEEALRGNAVELILPKYDCMRYDRIIGLSKILESFWVPFHDQSIRCDAWAGLVDGLKCFFIESHSHHEFFNRGIFYGHRDDPERYAFFCLAALEFMLKTGRHPDIIHCHDWQTGLVPLLLFEFYKFHGMTHPRVCFTLHNVGHQGHTGEHILRQVGLNPAYFMRPDRALDDHTPGTVNLMKTGIVFSNFVTTVSPRYAQEIRTTTLGHGLQRILNLHSGKFGGVLNGISYNTWNPEIDPSIPFHYGPDAIENKYRNKEALRDRLLLRQEFKPLIAAVGRLDRQKGVELVRHAIFFALTHGCQFVLLGTSPDARIGHEFWQLKYELNDHPDCHLELAYNEELSHLIYAGSDMIVIPSIYEPCGLTQMIGMKYGTVPIVRNTGGLADTVFDADYAPRPYHERNGFVFDDYSYAGIESALNRAVRMWYEQPQYFRELLVNGMRTDYSWNRPGSDYLNIYNSVREK